MYQIQKTTKNTDIRTEQVNQAKIDSWKWAVIKYTDMKQNTVLFSKTRTYTVRIIEELHIIFSIVMSRNNIQKYRLPRAFNKNNVSRHSDQMIFCYTQKLEVYVTKEQI